MTGVVNALYNEADMILCVLDNSTTAMTGHQPHPGTGRNMMGDVVAKVSITKILEGMGVQKVVTVDPLNLQESVETVRECAALPGVKAIIFKSPCVAITKPQGKMKIGESCIGCKTCSIMSGFGGAGAFSDGKYNITNDFGGTLYEYIGKKEAIDLMRYVDTINLAYGGEGTKLYSTAGSRFKKQCMQNDLHLLDASVRHLGTDINYVVLENLYEYLKDKVEFYFDTLVEAVEVLADGEEGYRIQCKDASYTCKDCIISVGRSGSKWMEEVCKDLSIPTNSNRVDIGVRVELPAEIFSHLTDELYLSLIHI